MDKAVVSRSKGPGFESRRLHFARWAFPFTQKLDENTNPLHANKHTHITKQTLLTRLMHQPVNRLCIFSFLAKIYLYPPILAE